MSPLFIGVLNTVLASVISVRPALDLKAIAVGRVSGCDSRCVRQRSSRQERGSTSSSSRHMSCPRSSCPSPRCKRPSCRARDAHSRSTSYVRSGVRSLGSHIRCSICTRPVPSRRATCSTRWNSCPVVTALVGPGAAFSVLWFWREGKSFGVACSYAVARGFFV